MRRLFLILTLTVIFTLATTSETGDSCQITDDCPSLHSCIDNICTHKTLFPLTAREVVGTFIILFMSSLLTAGGVGGGAAYVPYIMLLFELDVQKAISYAYACAFGGGMGNIANTIFLKNPKTKRYMINFDINMIILPALMAGVLVGGILQRILPPLVTNILLLLVLGYSFYKNSNKLKALWKKEKHENQERKAIEMAKITQNSPQAVTIQPPAQQSPTPTKEEAEFLPPMVEYDAEHEQPQQESPAEIQQNNNDQEIAKPKDGRRSTIMTAKTSDPASDQSAGVSATTFQDINTIRRLEIEKKELKFPFHKLALLSLNVVIVILIGVIRGSKKFDPIVGVDWSCGWDFLWFAIALLLFCGASILNIYFVNKWQKEKIAVGYEFLPEEPLLTPRRIIQIKLTSIIGGALGSIVALGGGMVISPTLLDMGMPPAFCAAATGLLLAFSQFNTTFQNIMNKKISGLELAWFVPLGILCSYTSSKIVNYSVRKTGRQSIILIMLISITVAGFGCIVYNLINGLVVNFTQQTTFTNVC